MRAIGIVSLAIVALATPAAAQDGSAVIDAVTSCTAIKEDQARLACFDRAAATLAGKRRDGLVVLDRTEVREKRRSLFGLKLPDIKLFGDDEAKDPPISEISSTVASVRPSGRDRFIVKLQDGSVWRTTEPAKFDPERGDPVKVKRAALGSYRASFRNAFPVRVERVE